MITMTITGETALDIFATIKGFNALLAANVPTAQPDKPAKATPAPAADLQPAKAHVAPVQPAEAPKTATKAPETETPPWEDPAAAAPAPAPTKDATPEEVRAAGMKAARAHGNDAVKAVLTELGVDGMSKLAPEQRATFISRVEKLGETNA